MKLKNSHYVARGSHTVSHCKLHQTQNKNNVTNILQACKALLKLQMRYQPYREKEILDCSRREMPNFLSSLGPGS